MVSFRALSVCLLAAVVAGCGEGSSAGKTGAATPKDIVLKMNKAILDADGEALIGCFVGEEEALDVVSGMAEFMQAAMDFKKKFIAAYGEEGWNEFQDPDGAQLMLPTEEDIRKVEQADVKITGDKATVQVEGRPLVLTVVKIDGKWFIEASSMLSPGAQARPSAEFMRKMAKLISRYSKAVGHEGITAEDIDVELGHAIGEMLFGMKPQGERRFDIDAIK